jgi:hypothetical protein
MKPNNKTEEFEYLLKDIEQRLERERFSEVKINKFVLRKFIESVKHQNDKLDTFDKCRKYFIEENGHPRKRCNNWKEYPDGTNNYTGRCIREHCPLLQKVKKNERK